MVTKSTAKKKPTTKHKTTVKSRSRTQAKAQIGVYRTFKVAPDSPAFLEPRVTKQTFYWSLLLLFIIIMQLILIAINVNASLNLY